MKSRINIWNQRSSNEEQISTKQRRKQKNTRQTNFGDGGREISNPNHARVQSTFEYEPIQPIQEPIQPNFDDIEHEDGDYPPMDRRGGGGILKKHQKRRHSLSVAVSEEEAEMLRDAARAKGMTFSNWARKTLFRSAGMSMPKRPK